MAATSVGDGTASYVGTEPLGDADASVLREGLFSAIGELRSRINTPQRSRARTPTSRGRTMHSTSTAAASPYATSVGRRGHSRGATRGDPHRYLMRSSPLCRAPHTPSPAPTRYTGQRVPQHVGDSVDYAIQRLYQQQRSRSRSASPPRGDMTVATTPYASDGGGARMDDAYVYINTLLHGGEGVASVDASVSRRSSVRGGGTGDACEVYPEDSFPASPMRARRLVFAPETSRESPSRRNMMPIERSPGERGWRPPREAPYPGYPGDGCITPRSPAGRGAPLLAAILRSPDPDVAVQPDVMRLPSRVAGGLVSVAMKYGWPTARLNAVAQFLLDQNVQVITIRHRTLFEKIMRAQEADYLINHTAAFTSFTVFAYGHIMAPGFWSAAAVPPALTACREPAELRDHTLRFDHHACLAADFVTLLPITERQGLPSVKRCRGHTVYGVVYSLPPQAVLIAAQHLPNHMLETTDVYLSKSYVRRSCIVFNTAQRTNSLLPDVGYLRYLVDACSDFLPSRYVAHLNRIMAADGSYEPSWKRRHKSLALTKPFPSPERQRLI